MFYNCVATNYLQNVMRIWKCPVTVSKSDVNNAVMQNHHDTEFWSRILIYHIHNKYKTKRPLLNDHALMQFVRRVDLFQSFYSIAFCHPPCHY